MDLQPLDDPQIAGVDAGAAQSDMAPHPVTVGDASAHRDRRPAERTLILAKILLELCVGAGRSTGGAVPHERFGDQLIDSAEITIGPRSFLPASDDFHRFDRDRRFAAHDGSIAEPTVDSVLVAVDGHGTVAYAGGMATLVLTLVGDDRTGLVNAVAEAVAAHGGNWERSQVAELAGKFAGIVVVTVSDDRSDELIAALEPVKGMLDVTIQLAADEPPDHVTTSISLDLIGTDRPGIVSDITRVLTEHGVNIESLTTATRHAAMAGGVLFEAAAELEITPAVDLIALQQSLEQIANELMVDLTLEA